MEEKSKIVGPHMGKDSRIREQHMGDQGSGSEAAATKKKPRSNPFPPRSLVLHPCRVPRTLVAHLKGGWQMMSPKKLLVWKTLKSQYSIWLL